MIVVLLSTTASLDVSYLVACRLGILDSGITRLRVELLEVPKRP